MSGSNTGQRHVFLHDVHACVNHVMKRTRQTYDSVNIRQNVQGNTVRRNGYVRLRQGHEHRLPDIIAILAIYKPADKTAVVDAY